MAKNYDKAPDVSEIAQDTPEAPQVETPRSPKVLPPDVRPESARKVNGFVIYDGARDPDSKK